MIRTNPRYHLLGNTGEDLPQQVAQSSRPSRLSAWLSSIRERVCWPSWFIRDISDHQLGCDCGDCPEGEAWCRE